MSTKKSHTYLNNLENFSWSLQNRRKRFYGEATEKWFFKNNFIMIISIIFLDRPKRPKNFTKYLRFTPPHPQKTKKQNKNKRNKHSTQNSAK